MLQLQKERIGGERGEDKERGRGKKRGRERRKEEEGGEGGKEKGRERDKVEFAFFCLFISSGPQAGAMVPPAVSVPP